MENDKSTVASRRHRIGRTQSDKIVALLLVVIFSMFLLQSLLLPFGRLAHPGAGLWPTIISVAGIGLCILLFITGKETLIYAEAGAGRRFFTYAGCLLVYPMIYSVIGFVPASAFVLVIMLKVAGEYGWLKTTAFAITFSLAVYGLFGVVLDLPIDAF